MDSRALAQVTDALGEQLARAVIDPRTKRPKLGFALVVWEDGDKDANMAFTTNARRTKVVEMLREQATRMQSAVEVSPRDERPGEH